MSCLEITIRIVSEKRRTNRCSLSTGLQQRSGCNGAGPDILDAIHALLCWVRGFGLDSDVLFG
jgi:hypothetical protein